MSLRRLFVHESIYDDTIARLKELYVKVPVGNPLQDGVQAFTRMQDALEQAKGEGGTVTGGERVTVSGFENGYYVRSVLVEMPAQTEVVLKEIFAPILYVMRYTDFDAAIAANNAAARARFVVVRVHHRPARGGTFPVRVGQRLRHREREHRAERRGDRRSVWRREGNRQ